MDDAVKERLSKIEWTLERHGSNIKDLFDNTEELNKALQGIHQTLVQIKWFGMGCACIVMADQFGLASIFRLMGG